MGGKGVGYNTWGPTFRYEHSTNKSETITGARALFQQHQVSLQRVHSLSCNSMKAERRDQEEDKEDRSAMVIYILQSLNFNYTSWFMEKQPV